MSNADLMIKINLPFDFTFIAEPVVNPAGKVMALEILSRFNLSESDGKVLFPSEFLFSKATKDNKKDLFVRQLETVNGKSSFFIENNVLCTLNVDVDIAGFICNTPTVESMLLSMPFIRLEISETFPGMSETKTNKLLYKLSSKFGLWLDDFGAGHANLSALQSGLFETVKIDKKFFWKHAESPLWTVVLREIRRHTASVVVEGVETQAQVSRLRNLVEGMQGYLFPASPLHSAHNLLNKYSLTTNSPSILDQMPVLKGTDISKSPDA